MKAVLLLSAAILFMQDLPAQDRSGIETFVRRQTTGKTVTYTHYTLSRSGTDIVEQFEDNVITLTDASVTTRWELTAESGKTRIVAVSSGDRIVVNGFLAGKPMDAEMTPEKFPWAQDQTAYLACFAKGEKEKCVFVTLIARDGGLNPYTFEAFRKGVESVAVNGRLVRAVRVRLSLPGIMSMFWYADYWFEPGTGRFLRYESRHGVPEPIIIEPVDWEES